MMAFIFKDTSMDIVTLLVIALTCVYWYSKYKFGYWKRLGVKSLPVTSPLGNFGPAFMQKMSMGELSNQHYHSTTEPYVGLYAFIRPIFLARDPEIIRHIFIKDFQHFVDRGIYCDEKNDPISAHLFSMSGDKWKNLRTKLTPTFTSGKLKAMFSTLVACGDPLQKYLRGVTSRSEVIEVREIAARYTTNVIASVAFGVEINCIDNPDTPFRKYGRKVFEFNLKNGLRSAISFLFPKLMKILRIRAFDREVEEFMTALVKSTLEMREKNNIVRKDFFQLLLQLRNTGNVQLDDKWETVITADNSGKKLSLNEMTAQAILFYLAGFETTSTTISFCMFEIARNANIQRKVHEEVDDVLEKHNGKITYESISEMKYLENCIDETLRKYPPVPILNRECTKEYKLPDSDAILEKGTAVMIPIMAIQHDEKYFPDPLKFNPDRFNDKDAIQQMTNLPFGDGPRNCIGLRLGKMQTKVGIVLMMQNCQYELEDPQYINKELSFSEKSFILAPKSGIRLKTLPRKK